MDQSGRIYLNREEQTFLMEWLDTDDPIEAAEKFAHLLAIEKCDPMKLQDYLKNLMARIEKNTIGKK